LGKILERDALIHRIQELKQAGRRIVFTNGCFDILHPGHIRYLQEARSLGDALVIGVNSDRSVREIKGPQRPILSALERCLLLSGLESVSYVTVFDESTPLALIRSLLPQVLVKGGDYSAATTAGAAEVIAAGGRFQAIPFAFDRSTTDLVRRIRR